LLKKLLHDPLSHFLILGTLLFFIYAFLQDNEKSENEIIISTDRIEQLTLAWEKKSFRTITEEEKQKMIEDEIYQTVLWQEALKVGLDKNDNEIKRRLAQKMEFIVYDTYTLPIPNDSELKEFMLTQPKKYVEDEKRHFTQSILGTDTIGFDKEYTLTKFEVSNVFGRAFAEILFSLNIDKKLHKIESDYGVHDVYLVDKGIRKEKSFNSIKEKIKDDYLNLQREQKNKTIYNALKSQYIISIEER